MRNIYLMRHAKTEIAARGQGDAERALTERGRADAAAMGAWLTALPRQVDAVFCSTATRTRQTLEGLDLTLPTQLMSGLYLASPGEILAALQDADNALNDIVVLGHNPGIHELAVMLMAEAEREEDIDQLATKFPTCTVAHLRFDGDDWADLAPGRATLMRVHVARCK